MMLRRVTTVVIVALFALISVATTTTAQTLTGQLGGTVIDSSKGVLPGATVTIKNESTSTTLTAVTDANGAFLITGVIAGRYTLTATLTGFKGFEAKGIIVTATERVSVPITLEVGAIAETVTVQAESLKVQTTSGERSAVMTAEQIEDIGLRGRDFMGTLKTLPGVVDTSARDAPGWGSVGNMTVNGQGSFNFSYDGVTNKDTGSNSGNYAAPALDSIAEVKLQASNFQAEYGRTSGATIVVVTKSGSARFRGSAAYFQRNEAFNANTWDRRRSCDANPIVNGAPNPNCEKAQYRYNNPAYTIGGPVLIPGSEFNRKRDKLFFFWSQDLLPRKDPGGLQRRTMPTAIERLGDFSQTIDNQGRVRFIRDPRKTGTCNVNTGAGGGCFDGNIIPQSMFNPIGANILNLFPLPNAIDPTGTRQYNYEWEGVIDRLRTDQVLRVDWNVRPGTSFYSRMQFGHEVCSRGYTGACAGLFLQGNWPQMRNSYDIDTFSIVNTLIHSINSSTVLELTGGLNYSKQIVYHLSQADLDGVQRSIVGIPDFFPAANPQNLIPNITVDGSNALPNTAVYGGFGNRYPFNATNPTWDFTANLTKLKGSHNFKAGLFVERVYRPARRASTFNGALQFNSNASNPLDVNFGFANALLGVVNQYQQSTAQPFAEGRFNQIEFFVQDNWRLQRNFTVDLGIRFVHVGPTYVAGQDVAYFDPAKYDPTRVPVLYQPVCPNNAAICTGAQRLAKNPLTGELVNQTFIGKFVPGSGDFANGMVVTQGTPPQFENNAFYPSPRAGFAWDVTGDGKTSIRGGMGVNIDRYNDDIILSLIEQPPLMDTLTTNWLTIPQLLATPTLLASPRSVSAFEKFKPSTVINWSVGVQRALPWKLTGDVAYVGNTPRNVARNIPINDLTPAQLIDPAFLDPTQANAAGALLQRIATDYLRPYQGLGAIGVRRYFEDGVTYHSIQVSLTRRMSNGLGGSIAYTGTRSKGLRDYDWFRTEEDNRARYTTAAGSRPHIVVIGYNYLIPGVSRFLKDNVIARGALDGWQLSGVTEMRGGQRSGFSYGFTGAPTGDLTQGLGGSRVVLTCDPNLPRNERTFERQFRTECIRPPGPSTDSSDLLYQGSALGDEWISLGFINHDITLFKNFSMSGGRNLRVQVELYNAFNSTQYSAVDTGAVFNFATGEQTDTNFGRVTGVRGNSNRVIQLGVRFTF